MTINERMERTQLSYLESMQRVASSLELIAFESAPELEPEETTELFDIITRLQRFIAKCAERTGLRRPTASRLH